MEENARLILLGIAKIRVSKSVVGVVRRTEIVHEIITMSDTCKSLWPGWEEMSHGGSTNDKIRNCFYNYGTGRKVEEVGPRSVSRQIDGGSRNTVLDSMW